MLRQATVVALAFFSGHGSAQGSTETATGAVFGTAKTAQGTPWVGATVHLFARPIAYDERIGRPDRITTTTDATGRFRAPVHRRLHYDVWASQRLDGGKQQLSPPVQRVVAGTPLRLVGEPTPRQPGEVTFLGLQNWRQQAPFSCEFRSQTGNVLVTRVPLTGTNTIPVPAFPGYACTTYLFGKDGYPISVATLRLLEATATVKVRKPRRYRLPATDNATGKPLATVEVQVALVERQFPVGTAAAGQVIALPPDQLGLTKLAAAKGFAPGGLFEERRIGPGATVRGWLQTVTEIEVKLHPAGTLGGRVLLAPTRPAARMALIVRATAHNANAGTGYTRLLYTDAEGRFTIPDLPPQTLPTVLAVLEDQHRRWLPAAWRHEIQTGVPLLLPAAQAHKSQDVGDIDLSKFVPLRILATTKRGDPADRPVLRLCTAERERRNWTARAHAWVGDRRGALHLLMPESNEWLAWLEDADAVTCHGLILRRAPRDPGFATLRWALDRPVWIAGRVLQKSGHPAPGAGVHTTLLERIATWPEPPPAPLRIERNHASTWETLPPEVFRYLISRISATRHTNTDLDGRFKMVLPPGTGACIVSALSPPNHSLFQQKVLGDQPIRDLVLKLH